MSLSPCNSTIDKSQRELVEHGSLRFPIACYDDDLGETPVPWHWHEEFEFAIVTRGRPVCWVENTRIPLEPGEGIFINSLALHAADQEPPEGPQLHSAVFHPRLIGGSMDSIFWQKLVQPLLKDSALRYLVLKPEIPWHRQVLDCFGAAWQAVVEEPEDYELRVREELSRAFALLNRNCATIVESLSEQQRVDAGRIRTMLEFIDRHASEELTIEEIAASVSVSESVCLRCFRQFLGTTPIQYVKNLRLDRAAQMLRSTAKTAREIAWECGFNDVSYFTKSFREKQGCTPTEYRSRNQS